MSESAASLRYPLTAKVDQVDDYHGIKVADPYRWLEDPNSDETKTWIAAQNEVTFGYLNQLASREPIKERLTQLWNYEKFSIPFKKANRYFYFKNDGLQNQDVLYTLTDLAAEPQVLIDPNTFSADGTIALSGIALSEDARLIAYGVSASGSDWQEWKVRQVETGADLPDHVQWIKFSGASWTRDNQGFFYSRYDEPNDASKLEDINYFQKLYYHQVGTAQSDDVLVYERPDQKDWMFGAQVTEDGRYLIIDVDRGTEPKNLVFWKDLTQPNAPVVELINTFEASYRLIENEGSIFWFTTDLDAPKGRVIAIDLTHPEQEHWRELIPEAVETLLGVSVVNQQFIAFYLKDAHTRIKTFHLDGTFIQDIELPGIGAARGFDGKREDTETFYSFTSFTTPTTIYRYDFATGESTVFRQPQVDFNPDQYQTTQVFYTSNDGTQVPMFIVHKTGIALDGNNPTYLYGYGGFNISLTPFFSPSNLVWMEMGGVVAIPN
ncbi:S9 family peptidase, partial [Oculatella sp. LEGE 06141]|uniref:prolyl oligopeptidase family serine peptidase n=1 Tax=Oculatella sp. LEGE 06141 TaxID=1828648 RepID=UPI001880A31B